MMGPGQVAQGALFYEFSIEDHVPRGHLLRAIDRFVDLTGLRQHLVPYYSSTGRPSIDPELMLRMLLAGYVMGIRSERRLCEEVHLNLAYRWFCRLDLTDGAPDWERQTGSARLGAPDWERQCETISPEDAPRAVREYLETLDDAAFGAASPVKPKFTSHSDPASQWTGARGGPAFFVYSANYLIDTDVGVILDVEATRSIRQAEVGAVRTMVDRVGTTFDLKPERLIADTAYGTGEMLDWLHRERGIAPHIPVIDKSARTDGTFERADFTYDAESDVYICPAGKELRQYRRAFTTPRSGANKDGALRYRARKPDCDACALKPRCCPKEPQRKVARSVFEPSRNAARAIAQTAQYAISCKLRKKVEMLLAHLKRILGLASGLGVSDCEGRAARVTSSTSQPQPRTSESWRRCSHLLKPVARRERGRKRPTWEGDQDDRESEFFNRIVAVLILAWMVLAQAALAEETVLDKAMRKNPDRFAERAVDLVAGFGGEDGLRPEGIEENIALERAGLGHATISRD